MSDAELDAARIVLEICASLHVRSGQVVPAGPLWHQKNQRGLNQEEFGAAIDKCVELGWFKPDGQGNCLLTDAGFAAMKQNSEWPDDPLAPAIGSDAAGD